MLGFSKPRLANSAWHIRFAYPPSWLAYRFLSSFPMSDIDANKARHEATQTAVATSLIDVYRESHYHIAGAQPALLLLDTYSANLAAIHQRAGVTHSVFITACNPRSAPLDAATNAQRQDLLAQTLQQHRVAFIDAWGEHPSNGWPKEPSFLALGLSLEMAKIVGRHFDQNAILYSGEEAVMRLVLLR